MKSPPRKDFDVYDFNEEDEAVEKVSGRLLSKFGRQSRNPNDDGSQTDKFNFLQVFAPGMHPEETVRTDVICVDIGETNGDSDCSPHASHKLRPPVGDSDAVAQTSAVEGVLVSPRSDHSHNYQDNYEGNMIHGCFKEALFEAGVSSPVSAGNNQFDCNASEHPDNIKQDDVNSNDNDGNWTCSSSCHSSDQTENEGSFDQLDSVDCWSGFRELEDIEMAVSVSPDYVVYGDELLYGESQLTFLSDCIRIECSDTTRSEGPFISEWAIADLLHIGCHWSQSVETAWVEVQSKATNGFVPSKVYDVSGTVRLIFTVFGPQWLKKEQKIMSLASRYKAIWKVEYGEVASPDSVMGLNLPVPRRCLTDFEEGFEDIIYPIGDPDAVSISRRDIELLQPETFINDTIIDFYIKYLKNKMEPEENNRFHFFNSFFFRKLADLDKDPQSRLEGRAAFLRVRKWTRKVNFFEKDYIFIPVNFNLHWSLLVICHPGEIAGFVDEEINESLKVPCVLHMDSIKGSHTGLKSLMQSYLWEEWKERHPESSANTSSNFSNLRFVSLEVPQQENMFDCGLFLLHFVELFLKEAPVAFSPFKITNFSNFLSIDWFVPAEASFKRFLIRDLLYDLLRNPSLSHEQHLSGFPDNNVRKESAVELLSTLCSTAITCPGDSASPVANRGIELELLARSSLDNANCEKDGLVEWQFLEPRADAESCPAEEGAEQLPYPDIEKDSFRPLNGITTTAVCSTSCSSKDLGALGTLNLQNTVQLEVCDGNGSLSETLNSESPNSSKQSMPEYDVNSHNFFPNHSGDIPSIQNKEADKLRLILTGNGGHSPETSDAPSTMEMPNACTVEDSQEVGSHPAISDEKVQKSTSAMQEKYRNVPDSPHPSSSGCMLHTCIVEDSQEDGTTDHVTPDEGIEKSSFVPEKYRDVPYSSQEEDTTYHVTPDEGIENSQSFSPEKCKDLPESPRAVRSREMLEDCSAHECQDVKSKLEINDPGDPSVSSQEHHADLPHQDAGHRVNVISLDDCDAQVECEDLVLSERRPCKRQKLQQSGFGRMRTRSLTRNSSL